MSSIRTWLFGDAQRALTLLLLVGLYGFFALYFSNFTSTGVTFSLVERLTVVGLVSLGVTVNMISGEIDLSVGSLAAMSGVITIQLYDTLGPGGAILLSILIAVLIGTAHGFIIAKTKLPGIVLTIGSLVALRGLSLTLAGEKTVALKSFGLSDFIQMQVLWPFSPASIVAAIIFLVVGCFLAFHRYGRELYAVGGARNEAIAAGVPLVRPLIISFVISAVCSSLAGILLALRSGSAQPLALQDLLLIGVTAAFVGGVHVAGGRGTAIGTLIGALIIQVLSSGMIRLNAPNFIVGLVLGVLLMVVIVLQLSSARIDAGRARARRLQAIDQVPTQSH